MHEWEEIPALTQGLGRSGSAGITPQIRRVNGRCTKYNFDDDDGG